jgi:hypothetical protein
MFDEVEKIIWGRFSGSDTPWFLKLVYVFRFNVINVINMLWYRESYEKAKGRLIQQYVQKAYDDKKSNWLATYNADDNTALSRPEYEGAKFPWMLLLLVVIALYSYNKGRK